jgi:hypothetical protein
MASHSYSTLPKALKRSIHFVALAVLTTGIIWVALRAVPDDWISGAQSRHFQAQLLKLHGATAMLALIAFGALLVAHILPALKSPPNRAAGISLLSCAGSLALTGWGLYYIGEEELRGWASDLHIVIGVSATLIFAWHVSYRIRGRARHAFQPVERSGGY